MKRVFNFNPGPSGLPLEVLEQVQKELLDFKGTGMSILEMSHRSKDCIAMMEETEQLLKDLLDLPQDYKVLFLQGGASSQFSMVPQNLLQPGSVGNYILTGSFAEKAYKEAALIGEAYIAASSKADNYNRIVAFDEIKLSENPAYVHLTSNNTIFGTQWKEFPDLGEIPVVVDMSSDILARKVEAQKFDLIYAGAQKNLGPAGVTIVILSPRLQNIEAKTLPSMLRYDLQVKNDSSYNTPPVFAIYMVNLVLKWLRAQGGVNEIEQRNIAKSNLIYQVLDNFPDFYRGHAEPNSRSTMNITFRLPNEELEAKFVKEATARDLVGLKGHRSVGGIRASVYNSMPLEGCEKLAQFMIEFCQANC